MMALSDPECMSAAIEKYGTSYRIASETLSQDQIKWLDSLPYVLDINLDNRTFYVTHGSLESIDEYIYPDESRDTLLNQMSDSDYTILGHTHYPFICSNNDKWLINPGSVGQPRDYCASASFFIVNLKTNMVIPKRVKFQIEDILKHVDLHDQHLTYLKTVLIRT